MDRLKKIEDWINSSEGQRALEDSYLETKRIVDDLQESRKVDMKTLWRPFDI